MLPNRPPPMTRRELEAIAEHPELASREQLLELVRLARTAPELARSLAEELAPETFRPRRER